MPNKKYLGVELIEDSKNRKLYRTSCACHSPEHRMDIEIEKMKDEDLISVCFIVQTDFYVSLDQPIWKRWKQKFSMCWKTLKGEPLEYTGEFLFRDFNHARDFVDMLYYLAGKMKGR